MCGSMIRYLKIDFLILFGNTIFECLVFIFMGVLFFWERAGMVPADLARKLKQKPEKLLEW